MQSIDDNTFEKKVEKAWQKYEKGDFDSKTKKSFFLELEKL
jgi:hypothetical protein